jgi:hypothetical protein
VGERGREGVGREIERDGRLVQREREREVSGGSERGGGERGRGGQRDC